MDARFVDGCRWRLWQEHFVNSSGEVVRTVWGIDLGDAKAPTLEVFIRPYRNRILSRAIFYLTSLAVLLGIHFLIRPEWLMWLVFVPAFMAFYFGQYFVFRDRPIHTYQPPLVKNKDLAAMKKQVADLLYAASTAPSLEAMRALAKNNPEYFVSRRDEIVRLFRDEKNKSPIKSDDRRRLITEFAMGQMSEVVEPLRRDIYSGDDATKCEKAFSTNRKAIEDLLQAYHENEHRVLMEVMHQRYVSGKAEAGIDNEILELVTRAMDAHSDRERAAAYLKDALHSRYPTLPEPELLRWHAWAMDLREELLHK